MGFKKQGNQKQLGQQAQTTASIKLLDDALSSNLRLIQEQMGNSSDITIRELEMGVDCLFQVAVVYIEGITDAKSIYDLLLQPILHAGDSDYVCSAQSIIQILKEKVIPLGKVDVIYNQNDLFSALVSGNTIILIDGRNEALSVDTKGGEYRAIEESRNEPTYRGTRESFTELLQTNIALLRRRLKDKNVWVESMQIGEVSKTNVAIMYIHGIANEKIIAEVRRRLNKIQIDAILESGYIEQLIEDQTFTPFPTIYNTEKPDVVTANLLEGKIAILVDGTPFVLTVPALFIEYFQAADDYYSRFDISTFIRFLRIFTFFISLIAPSAYIAVTTFHQEMLPTGLVFALASQREGIPFPAFVEALLMEVSFEILREAGVRLPRAIGSAVSIVGALVIGQAAVQAGIVSPMMVIVVSVTAVASFSTPAYNIAISIRLIRFFLMIAAAVLGFYGVIMGFIILMAHLCGLRSFGIPFMMPLAPFVLRNSGDTIVRIPLWMQKYRPRLISQNNTVRQGENQKPESSTQQEGGENNGKQEI
ncbi:MAG: spore germination protein [Ectobacillus sp.]